MSMAAWGTIALLSVVWGGAFFFTEVLEPYYGPYTIACGRVAIAAAGLWLVCQLRGKLPRRARLRDYAVGGLITFAIPFTCFAWAQTELTGGLTAIINAMTPIMVVIVSHLYPGGERATALKSTGVLIGFAGVALLIAPSAASDGLAGPTIAKIVALCGPLFYGVAANYTRRFSGDDPTATATGNLTAAALWTLPFALILDGAPGAAPPLALAAFLAFGLVSTALAFLVFYAMLPVVGATNFSVVTFLVPISAMALGAAFLGEAITASQLIGMAVIFFGLIFVDGRLPRMAFGARRRV